MEYHKIEAPDFEFGLAKNLVSKTAHVAHQAAQAVCRAVQRVRQSRQASTDRDRFGVRIGRGRSAVAIEEKGLASVKITVRVGAVASMTEANLLII